MSNTVLVVPTIREKSVREFLTAWESYGLPKTIIVEDNPTRTFDLSRWKETITHYSWEDIDTELNSQSWIIPRRTDGVRVFGFLKAMQAGADTIITLDDDCLPIDKEFFVKHENALMGSKPTPAWGTPLLGGYRPRGIPYLQEQRVLPTVVNIGLWEEVPDYDAVTQLMQVRRPLICILGEGIAPIGVYLPVCGMNLAFRKKVFPSMYFLLMGQGYEFDRFGDIWCGIITKHICDHLRMAISYGEPYVRHSKASKIFINLQKETPGLSMNETFWKVIDNIVLTSTTVAGCYREIALELPRQLEGLYWKRLSVAMLEWLELVGRYYNES